MQRRVRENSGKPSSYFTIAGGRKEYGYPPMDKLKLSLQAQRTFTQLNDVCTLTDRMTLKGCTALRNELPADHWLQPVLKAFVAFKLELTRFDKEREANNA